MVYPPNIANPLGPTTSTGQTSICLQLELDHSTHLIDMISNFCHGFQPLKDSSLLSPKACLVDFGGSFAAMDIYVLCHEVLSGLGGWSNSNHSKEMEHYIHPIIKQ